MKSDSPCVLEALRRFDEENSRDPVSETHEGQIIPRSLLHARRLTEWVLRLNPDASETLRLAARCQHIRRWEIPREAYPKNRAGYHRWRNELKRFHAEVSGEILRKSGCDERIADRVRALNLKSDFPDDPDSQTLEDALCLVFLQFQLRDLVETLEHEKLVNALRKSWAKMSPRAREQALALPLSDRESALIREALQPSA